MQLSTQETAARLSKAATPLSALIVASILVAAFFVSMFVLGTVDVTPAFADEPVAAAAAGNEAIADADNPLGAFQHDALCNIHYVIYVCTFLTLAYGATVVYRRLNDVKAFKEMDEAISRRSETASANALEDFGTVGA